jgi:probable HAF family extracellular repeat protein
VHPTGRLGFEEGKISQERYEMKTKSPSLYLILIYCILVAAIAAQAQNLTIKCSDVKVKGALETDSYAVNNAGVIGGDYVDSASVQHGLILNKKVVTSFDGPSGSSGIAAYGINNSNVVVGWYVDVNGVNQGFTYANGQLTSVFYPKSTGTQANGINDNGWVVGTYVDTAGVTHGFYWDTKKYHKVDVKGASSTTVWAINNSNVMTVYTIDTSTGLPLDGYTYSKKKFTVMDPPGYAGTAIHGINNNGDLNYTIFDSSSNRHGVLYQAATGVFTQFDDPKGTNTTRADGINDTDEMVGRYSPASGTPANAGFKCTVK